MSQKHDHKPLSLRERSKQLRREMTGPEKTLWHEIRGRRLGGLKFRRQYPIENFVVDFYCHEHKLIIELDGDSHNERFEYDRSRQIRLEKLGFRVERFDNDEVLKELDSVLDSILRACGKQT